MSCRQASQPPKKHLYNAQQKKPRFLYELSPLPVSHFDFVPRRRLVVLLLL